MTKKEKASKTNTIRLYRVFTMKQFYNVEADFYIVKEQTIEFSVKLEDSSMRRVAAFPLTTVDAVLDVTFETFEGK